VASIPRSTRRPAPPAIRLSLSDPFVRSAVYQVVVVAAVALGVWYLVSNTMANLAARNIASGFGFLSREAGLPIGEHVIDYTPADTYLRAIVVGVLNTLRVALPGIIFATIIGTLVGIGRLSRNWLVAKLCSGYVELLRNLPLAIQLIFWWVLITENFPSVRQAWNLGFGFHLSQRGLVFPVPVADEAHLWMLIAFVGGVVATWIVYRWSKRRQMATGQQFPTIRVGLALVLGLPLLAFLAGGAPTEMDVPVLRGFNFQGGLSVTPEFVALWIGLVTYTAAFIAEIVRAGILAVSHGQTEAAYALGVRPGLTLRLVVLPQALRVIIPPLISQYLNLTKNSTLALLIGYPDVVNIINTVINQTGQAVEGVAAIMAAFLSVSLSISALMNWYNKKIALVER
jgi:general L-amino acid transport system permease protein